MGDDYLGVYAYKEQPNVEDLRAALDFGERTCGITPERSIFSNPMDVSFISLGLWPRLDGGWQFVPHPAKQMRKLFWTARCMKGRSFPDQCTALAIAFLPTYAGFKLMHTFLRRHLIVDAPKYLMEASDHYMYAEALARRVRHVNWKVGFMHKYRLPYTACDWQLPRQTVSAVEIWAHPVAQHMLTVESQDPIERFGSLCRPQ
jgi:hypothetical protein